MAKYADHSDYANTDNAELSGEDVSHGRRMAYLVYDAQGYACGGWTWQAQGDEAADAHVWLTKNPPFPLSPEDVVCPPGYTLHPETGHGMPIGADHDGFYLRPPNHRIEARTAA